MECNVDVRRLLGLRYGGDGRLPQQDKPYFFKYKCNRIYATQFIKQ
jgi:hypothetical protein